MLDFETFFRRALLQWFRKNARDLPWRCSPTLYKTVVSEFMLQQTQVKTVLPYFERWMRIFPDFETLAIAPVEAVMYQWSGLGYYARARYLQATAQRFIQDPPQSFEALKTCPGIGSYTAAAIASIAWNAPVAAVDGNVVRVLARLLNILEPFASKSTAVVWATPHAQRLLDKKHAGTFNEALMELGAVVCTPALPQCSICPLKMLCRAYGQNTIGQCPRFQPTQRFKNIKNRLWVLRNDELLLEPSHIGSDQLLWELPELTEDRRRLLSDLRKIFCAKRTITNTTYTETIFKLNPSIAEMRLEPSFTAPPFEGCRFFPTAQLHAYALSGPHRKWLKEILHPTADRRPTDNPNSSA